MSVRTLDLRYPVSPAEQFDEAQLLRYARENVNDFPVSPARLTLSQFGHGQSNPTFLMEVGDGASCKRYVLKKKPSGQLLESAHAIEREFQVMEALGLTKLPVPKVYCICHDASVIGTAFYIMEFLDGRIFLDPKLPGLIPEQRKEIYLAIAKTLAMLHMIIPEEIELSKYGRRNNYCRRQIERWSKQYLSSTVDGNPQRNPKMLELVEWLRQHIPVNDASEAAGTGLLHGDFRLDNLVFHSTECRVVGVLDWELSTLGNQMCDLAYSCLPYIVDARYAELQSHEGFEVAGIPEGIPSLAEYVAHYCSVTGTSWPSVNWKFYVAFSLFRAASISAGVYHRWILGNASGGRRARHGKKLANVLVESALSVIDQQFVLPLKPPSDKDCWLKDTLRQEGDPEFTSRISKFSPCAKVHELREKLVKFIEGYIYPMEAEFSRRARSSLCWSAHPVEEKLKDLAQREGLWNLWLPLESATIARKIFCNQMLHASELSKVNLLIGAGLTNLEYGYLCEVMGRSIWAPQIFNCGAPDTGNMEVLLQYGSKEQQEEWLVPLLEGKIRSGFAMTEPDVASSDATNISCSIEREGNSYVINGTKWWTSGAMDSRCKLLLVMGKTDPTGPLYKQQSVVLVDVATPGVNIKRPLLVFGFDDAPHGHAEISFKNVRVPITNVILGEGRGFEIAQGRLGPGRLHHCMRLVGAAERGMQLMVQRALSRRVFGKLIADQGSFLHELAKCRVDLDRTRLLVLEAADLLDRSGGKAARGAIAMAKVAAPCMALKVLDTAMQVYGAAGFSSDTVLAQLWVAARTLRIADGPDEVHLQTIAKLELKRPKL